MRRLVPAALALAALLVPAVASADDCGTAKGFSQLRKTQITSSFDSPRPGKNGERLTRLHLGASNCTAPEDGGHLTCTWTGGAPEIRAMSSFLSRCFMGEPSRLDAGGGIHVWPKSLAGQAMLKLTGSPNGDLVLKIVPPGGA